MQSPLHLHVTKLVKIVVINGGLINGLRRLHGIRSLSGSSPSALYLNLTDKGALLEYSAATPSRSISTGKVQELSIPLLSRPRTNQTLDMDMYVHPQAARNNRSVTL